MKLITSEKLFEFLIAPAIAYMWLCAKMCGGTLTTHIGDLEDIEDEVPPSGE